MTTYAQWFPLLLPGGLSGRWAHAWVRAHAETLDAYTTLAQQAVFARFVTDPENRGRQCADDALPYHGRAQVMPRLPGESVDSYRARLADPWNAWSLACARDGIEGRAAQLGAAYGFASWRFVAARGWSVSGAMSSTPDGRGALWARWWLLVFDAPWLPRAWGDGHSYSDRATWGTDATTDVVDAVRSYLRAFTSARDRFYVRLYVDTAAGGVWSPWGTWGDGSWAPSSARFIEWRDQ